VARYTRWLATPVPMLVTFGITSWVTILSFSAAYTAPLCGALLLMAGLYSVESIHPDKFGAMTGPFSISLIFEPRIATSGYHPSTSIYNPIKDRESLASSSRGYREGNRPRRYPLSAKRSSRTFTCALNLCFIPNITQSVQLL
jgi:hypothetical protein